MIKEHVNEATYFNDGGPMDTGYPALITDLPYKPNITKSPKVPGVADSKVPQSTPTHSDAVDSPPTIKQAS